MASRRPKEELLPLSVWQKSLVYFSLLFWAGYLIWRVTNTMNWEHPVYTVVFFVAEVIGFISLARFAFTVFRLRKREVPELRSKPTVDVLIATYNEEPEILLQTIYHCSKMDYPHQTYVLDDGRRPEIEKLAKEMGVHYISRPNNKDAKAGNLNHALPQCKGEIVAVLDADGVPRRDFLTKLLGYFQDPQVALVQVPQTFYNLDSFQHLPEKGEQQIWHEQSLFFDIIQPGLDYRDASMCCGSGSLIRRKALDRIGGFTLGTVTEDLHTTLKMHLEGFKTVYHAESLAYCLAPSSVLSYIVQRARWSLGSMQMLRKEGRRILGPSKLSLHQKFLYITPIYYLTALQKTLYYVAPFYYLAFDVSPFQVPDWFAIPLLINIVLTISAFRILSRGRARIFMTEVFFLYTVWAYLKAMVLGLIPVKWGFKVTPKQVRGKFQVALLVPALAVLGISAAAVGSGIHDYLSNGFRLSLAIALSFAWINFVTAFAAVMMSGRRPFSDEAYSFFDYRPLKIEKVDSKTVSGQEVGIATVISEKRLHFVHVKSFAIGTRLTVELDLPDADVTLNAKVVSCKPHISAGQELFFQVELQYVALSHESRMELIRYFFEDATPKTFSKTDAYLQTGVKTNGGRNKGPEQRKQTRIPSLIPIFIIKDSATGQDPALGLLVDLSPRGARIKLPAALELRSRVEVRIPWFNGTIGAKVMRCSRESGQLNPPCDIGLEFEKEISLTDRQMKSIQVLKTSTAEMNPAA